MNTPKGSNYISMCFQEQREYLQEMNPDKLAGVFNVVDHDYGDFQVVRLPNVLACYPSQLEDGEIQIPEDFESGDIIIINMGALRKGDIEILAGNEKKLQAWIDNPVLLSPGVIEYWESDGGKQYTQTVLRDNGEINSSAGIKGLADANQRTTTAGRNFTGKLHEDLEMENAEESPFLMQDENGNYALVTHNLEYKEYLIASIKKFLSEKYLSQGDENFDGVKRAFEMKFRGVKYEELGGILRTIIEKDNFAEYEWKEGEIEGLEKTRIELGRESGDFYVYHDKAGNTLEYRAIREITSFPEGFSSVGRIPLRLFLESQNQDPSLKKVENIGRYGAGNAKLVPTIQDVADRVSKTL